MNAETAIAPIAIEAHQVLQALQQHIGHRCGISGRKLAQQLEITERRLRDCISVLRDNGIAVCGTPETGYYIAETAEELDGFCAWLQSRAMHSLTLLSRLRKIPMQDLLGQLRIPT
jgi:biotin operon repressor